MNVALFGAGCFWGVEEYFKKIPGVVKTKVGYSGGTTKNPSYELVCNSDTNHAEVIEITFDENYLSYKELLTHFWKCHDPTTKNMQGPDIGTQYRSIIFYYNDDQKKIAQNSKIESQKKFKNDIVTEIVKADVFYLAEEYHQNYLEKLNKICK